MPLVVCLLAVWPLLELSSVFSSDEGSYAVQARALDHGDWDMGYAFAEADPAGTFVPFHGASVDDGRVVPYAAHPLWPTALHLVSQPLGEPVGLRVLGVGSVVVVAVLAWALAGHLGGTGARPWAFWVAAASSALGNAWVVWSHGPSAAAGGAVALGLLRAKRGNGWLVLGAMGAALSVMLRSEGVLWVAAVSAALVLFGVDAPARVRGLAIGLASATALVVERAWTASIIGASVMSSDGGTLGTRSGGATLDERLAGLRIALLDGALADPQARALGLASVVLVVGALVLAARGSRAGVTWAVGASAVVLALRVAAAPSDPVPGLLAAAPALLFATLWRPSDRTERWVPVAVGLFLAAVGASIYVDGGALQWGGRFLSPITPLLAALAGVGVSRVIHAEGLGAPKVTFAISGSVVVLLSIQATAAVVVPDRIRRDTADAVDRVVEIGPDVLITEGGQVARLDWQGWPERCWIALPDRATPRDVRELLGVLGRSGVRVAAYAGIEPTLLEGAGVDFMPEGARIGTLKVPMLSGSASISSPYRCGT